MKFQSVIGILFILASCGQKPTESREGDSVTLNTPDTPINNLKDCHDWLRDSIFSTGAFVRYLRYNDTIQIEWSNSYFKRSLNNYFYCSAAPSWIPTISWSTTTHIGLRFGCGNPCWGTIILPVIPDGPVIERMYDLDTDLSSSLIVYLENEDYDRLIVENRTNGKQQTIKPGVNCGSAFPGYLY